MEASKLYVFEEALSDFGELPDRSDPFVAHAVLKKAIPHRQMLITTDDNETRKIMQR